MRERLIDLRESAQGYGADCRRRKCLVESALWFALADLIERVLGAGLC